MRKFLLIGIIAAALGALKAVIAVFEKQPAVDDWVIASLWFAISALAFLLVAEKQ